MEAVLELCGVVKLDGQGNAVLRRADFAISESERVCFCGLSAVERGALVRLIGGLSDPDEGTVTLLGQELRSLNDRERAALRNLHIGYVSGEPGFCRDMTVLENTVLPLSFRGASKADRRELGLSSLERFGLAYAAFAYPAGLSPYEQILAALIRAVIAGPELLILDDVFTGLDEKETDKMAGALNSLDRKKSILTLAGYEPKALSTDSTIHSEYGRIVRSA